jgi:hypothetical protein
VNAPRLLIGLVKKWCQKNGAKKWCQAPFIINSRKWGLAPFLERGHSQLEDITAENGAWHHFSGTIFFNYHF